MSGIPYRCARSRTCCPSGGIDIWQRRCGSGGTGSVRCSPPRSGRRVYSRSYSKWHLDEVFVRINGKKHYLWRAMKRYGQPRMIVTDRLRSYRAAMNVIGNAAEQGCGRWLNSRAENSHQPFRQREGAMSKFRDVKTLQKLA